MTNDFENLTQSPVYLKSTTLEKMRMLKEVKHYSLESGCDANLEFYRLFDVLEKELSPTKMSLTDYFHSLQKSNGTSEAYTLTARYFGITEEEVIDIIEEGK